MVSPLKKIGILLRSQCDSGWVTQISHQLHQFTSSDTPIYIFSPRTESWEGVEMDYPYHVVTPFSSVFRKVTLDSIMETLAGFISKAGFEKIYLYGAGTHTRWVLDRFSALDRIKISGIIVSEKTYDYFDNTPVFAVDDICFQEEVSSLIIFSSLSYETEMFRTFRSIHPNIECIGIYNPKNHFLTDGLKKDYTDLYRDADISITESARRWIETYRPDVLINLDPVFYTSIQKSRHVPELILNGDRDSLKKQIQRLISDLGECGVLEKDNRPKLIYVDHSLSSCAGHYYTYAKNVLRAARGNYARYLLANESLSISFDEAEYVIPAFRYDYWGQDTSGLEIDLPTDESTDIVSKCDHVFRHINLTDGDIIFIPNISDRDICSIRDFLKTRGFGGAVLKLFLRYPLDERYDRLKILNEIKLLYPPTHFLTDTVELKTLHEQGNLVDVVLLPIPVVGLNREMVETPWRDTPLRVVSLGDARIEKGFDMLPELIKGFYQKNPKADLIFEIQTYTNSCDPKVVETQQTLKWMSGEYPIVLLDKCLTDEEYASLIERADIVLCLYDAEVYRYRSSHVMAEALCSGKELIILSGSSPANQLNLECPWIVLDQALLYKTLDWIYNHRSESLAIRDHYQKQFMNQCTGETLLDTLERIT